jgi:4-amino-4-deoxy-L-arabinose transferase-like glycosyltransferase
MQKKRSLLPFILLLAFAIRLIGILSRPIWYDEAFSILFAGKGPMAMLFGTLGGINASAAEEHPLAYYLLLWEWMRVFGESLAAARLLSILAGVVTVAISYYLARELFNEKTAALTSVFVALAPFQVHYSQEIRMYSFLALWLILATYAYVRGAKGDGTKWWVIFAVSAALAQYTHNLAAFYLVPLAATPLLRRNWKALRSVILSGLGALLLYLPWLLQLPSQLTKVSTAYWVERPGLDKLFTLLLVYVTNLPLPNNLIFVGLFIALAVVTIATLQTFRRGNRNANALWLFYLAFTPPLLLFIISQWVPVYVERALLPSGVIFCIWLTWAMFDTPLPAPIRNGLLALLAIGVTMGLYQHVTYRGFPYAPYQELDASLREQIQPGDAIIHSSKLSLLPAVYYDQYLPQIFIADPPGSNTDTLAEATRKVLGLTIASDTEFATRDARRVWFVIFKKSIEEARAAGATTHPHLKYLNRHFKLITTEDWGELQIYLFERQP